MNQSTTDQSEKNVKEEAFEALRKRESEEQQRRGSRSKTHQKVIMVPNFTEEYAGPTNLKAAQECSANAPELSLANQRRRVNILHVIFVLLQIFLSQEEAARRKAWDDRQEQRCLGRGRRGSRYELVTSHFFTVVFAPGIFLTIRPAVVKEPRMQLVDRRV